MPKRNILFVIIQMEMGGAEKLVYNLINKLDRTRFNPSIAYFYGSKAIKDFERLNIPIFQVRKDKKLDFSTFRQFNSIIKKENIDIVNAHHFMSLIYTFYGCKMSNTIKLIYTEHSEWEVDKISSKWLPISKFIFSRIDKIIGVNSDVTKSLTKKFRIPAPKAVTINNGVDLMHFGNQFDKDEIKKAIGLDLKRQVIGIVANFRKNKNHLFLLRAFAEILVDFKEVHLLLIGQGFSSDTENSENDIRQFIHNHKIDNHVTILGYRSDIAQILSILDIFCLTSYKEGLPISLIEAMASGKPVIGTDVEGIRNTIVHEKNGYLVEINNIEELKRAILTLLKDNDIKIKFAQESKKQASEKYSLDACILKYTQLFNDLFINTSQDSSLHTRQSLL